MSWPTPLLGALACVLALAVAAAHRSWASDVPPGGSSPRRAGLLLCFAALSALSTFALAALPVGAGLVVGLVTLLYLPGNAIVLGRGLDSVLDEVALSVVLSLAVLVLGGTLLATTHLWDPGLLAAVISVGTAPVLAWHGLQALAGHPSTHRVVVRD